MLFFSVWSVKEVPKGKAKEALVSTFWLQKSLKQGKTHSGPGRRWEVTHVARSMESQSGESMRSGGV